MVPATVERFHDATDSKFIEVAGGVRNTKWADLFEIGYAYFDLEKENQHGFTISTPVGEVVNFENFHNIHSRFKKRVANLELDFFGVFNRKTTVFVDTTRNRYDWFGDIISQGSNTSGEFGSKTWVIFDFNNFVGRFNASYNLGGVKVTLNHTVYK